MGLLFYFIKNCSMKMNIKFVLIDINIFCLVL